jgi:hypothetical protein
MAGFLCGFIRRGCFSLHRLFFSAGGGRARGDKALAVAAEEEDLGEIQGGGSNVIALLMPEPSGRMQLETESLPG